jgi:hypothetical protein
MNHSSNDMTISKSEAALANGLLDRVEYIAKLNPRGVRKLATSYGYPSPNSQVEAKKFLMRFLSDDGDVAVDAMLSIHPDKNAFMENLANRVRSNSQYNQESDTEDHYDNFIVDAIAGAVTGVAGAAKSIAGPSRKQIGADQMAGQNTTLQQAIAYKQKQDDNKSKTTQIIIWSSVGLFIVIAIVIGLIVYHKKK